MSGEPAPEARAATRARALAAAVVLGAPFVLAFFSGGYFDEPRLWAGLVVWCALGGLALTGARPLLPRSRAGRAALGGLAGLTALAALSLSWAPLGGPAQDDVQRLLLYLGALAAGAAALRGAAGRLTEPVLGLGAACVIGYGLSERLLPGLVDLAASATSHGRLDQPVTYWNAMGALGGLGLVLCARMAGDADRPRVLRALAAAVSPVLGLGVYLTFSRGSLAGLGAGAVALALLVPHRGELRGAGAALAAAAVAALASELPGLDPLAAPSEDGGGGAGLAMIAILAVCGAAAAAVALAGDHKGEGSRTGAPAVARPTRSGRLAIVLAVLAAALALAVAAGVEDRGRVDTGGSQRLASVESNRYDYWKVALEEFTERPIAGHGSGSFRVDWLRERTIPERVADAHSLYVETASELGLIGLAALALLIGGTAAAAAGAVRRLRPQAAGPVAALAAFAVQAGLDWHWEMPAVALVALGCAARAIVLHESSDRYPRPA